jgi:hypothetical protein
MEPPFQMTLKIHFALKASTWKELPSLKIEINRYILESTSTDSIPLCFTPTVTIVSWLNTEPTSNTGKNPIHNKTHH